MCVRMNVVCATAISARIVRFLSMCESGSALVGGNRMFEGVCICVRVCVVLLCSGWEVGNNNPSLVKHIQCGLNDTESFREKETGMCEAYTGKS